MSCCGAVPLLKKIDILEDTSPLGAYLNAEELERLASFCEVASIRVDHQLPESPFYCIYTGKVEVIDDAGSVLCTKYPGAFFTRRAGLVRGRKKPTGRNSQAGKKAKADAEASQSVPKPRQQRTSIVKDFDDLEDEEDLAKQPATKIVGKAAGKVLYIPAEDLDKFLFVCKPESAEVVKQITRTNIGTQLANVPFIEQCADLEPADLRALGEICSYRTFDANEVIFSQGDKAENFYIILKGSVDITIDVKALRGSGEKVTMGARAVGDSFGVAALVYNAAERKYSAVALERTLCLCIVRDNFGKFLERKPSIEDALMGGTKTFLLQRYAAMKVPIFAELDDAMLKRAAKSAKFAHYNEGDVIFHQGDAPSAFYVVLHGEVKMTSVAEKPLEEKSRSAGGTVELNDDGSFVKETKSIAAMMSGGDSRTLTVGMHFGEVGVLLPSTPCIATCTCSKTCTLLKLDSVSFIELFGMELNLLAEMQIKLLRHHSTLRAALNHKRCRALFETHIKGEYSDESIRFFDAVAAMLATADLEGSREGGGEEALMTLAKRIVNEYICDGADSQVNIPGGMQKEIIAADNAGQVTVLLEKLKDAQGELYLLMSRDNWSRFVKGKAFDEMLIEIGSYGESVVDLVSEEDLTMLVQDGEGTTGHIMAKHMEA